eukprot:5476589-Pyramimonas_sp.AAC.1
MPSDENIQGSRHEVARGRCASDVFNANGKQSTDDGAHLQLLHRQNRRGGARFRVASCSMGRRQLPGA